jgi:hypothetical protein
MRRDLRNDGYSHSASNRKSRLQFSPLIRKCRANCEWHAALASDAMRPSYKMEKDGLYLF